MVWLEIFESIRGARVTVFVLATEFELAKGGQITDERLRPKHDTN